MSQLMRFGRRIALPSTRQIRHELLVMMQEDQRREALKVAGVAVPSTPLGLDPPTPVL